MGGKALLKTPAQIRVARDVVFDRVFTASHPTPRDHHILEALEWVMGNGSDEIEALMEQPRLMVVERKGVTPSPLSASQLP